ncbi:MAG: Holliday junction branch migration protein RuvA, partial [Candidatus Dormiibacterota bacterium]
APRRCRRPMIGYLRGTVVRQTGDQLVVEVGGVGYLVSVPASAKERAGRVGERAELHVHTVVREDQLALFGFLTVDELELFELLIQVDGVGPKVGLAILSTSSLDVLRRAILAGEVGPIRRAQGVGPRTAQKVIIDLQPRLEAQSARLPAATAPAATVAGGDGAAQVEAALRGLGFTPAQAKSGVAAVEWSDELTPEQALAGALRALGSRR